MSGVRGGFSGIRGPRAASAPAPWPTGADGALSLNATSLTLPMGSVKNYSSISIINGGYLAIDPGTGWTVIGCSGNCTINTGGIIDLRSNQQIGPATETKTAPDGTSLSYTYPTNLGGDGGPSWSGNGGAGGTKQGGGGGSVGTGSDASGSTSGKGGDGSGDEEGGGAGGATSDAFIDGFGAFGNNGTSGSGTSGVSGGGAGSGGVGGKNGANLYLKVAGTLTVSGAVILSDGGGGGDGGAGATGSDPTGFGIGGGGGGGGAGGAGGKVVVKYHAGSITSGNISVTGGVGGGAGPGAAGSPLSPIDGANGADGALGSDGIVTITTF